MKILVDRGHGMNTPGKCSPNKTHREWAYCNLIAQGVVESLKNEGYDAELLVPEKIDIPLGARVRRTNYWCKKLGAKNVLLVSIHNNAASADGKWHNATGWEAWTSKGQTQGDKLATCLYQSAEQILRPLFPSLPIQKLIRKDLTDLDPDKEANFYILRKSNCAACLTENFFQDTFSDVKWLNSDQGKNTLISLHVNGIKNYIAKYT